MKVCRHVVSLIASVVGLAVFSGCGRSGEEPTVGSFLVYDQSHGCIVSLPENATKEGQRAAQLVQQTLAKASGLLEEKFPIRVQERASVGSIRLEGSNHRKVGEPRLGEKVAFRVTSGEVMITSYPADAIEAAAAWFLEQATGARWFMPGILGEHVPARAELRLSLGERHHSPSYISRNLGLAGSIEEQDWWSRNRLRGWFRHGHAMSALFRPDDLKRNPDFAPLVNGAKYFPQSANDGNWQPNIAAEGAAEHAAAVLRQRREFSSAIGMNDSMRFDQSDLTRNLIGEPRWFRLRPDYSKLVFGFVNEVAKRVPGRYLGAYAYDWTEDTPGFPIERNVVPYLTADRSEWFDPEFAEADKALIRRWVAAGPEVVGLYDYYYGAPFLVPRPTLYTVAQSIPFAHEAGVRAFYAEVYPNWGLDGPKAWLAAQLLWEASAKPEDLLDIYYRDFWREAAGPMREYFERCDQQWLNQPKPSYWIKYYKDEHQHLLFPPEVRLKLRALLARAQRAATTELTRQRVEFFSQAFTVTEAFCEWEESKERLSRLALASEPDQGRLREAWAKFSDRDKWLKQVHARVTKEAPRAVKAEILGDYERNDPRRRAAWRLKEAGTPLPAAADPVFVPRTPSSGGFTGKELLTDVSLSQLKIRPPVGAMDLEWVVAGAWRGHGEPYQTRRVSVERAPLLTAPLFTAVNPEFVVRPEVAANANPVPVHNSRVREIEAGRTEDPPTPGYGEASGGQRTESGAAHKPSLEPPQASTLNPHTSGETILRFAGCKQETFSQFTAAEPGRWYVARVKVRAKVSPGNMTFLILNFQDEARRSLGMGAVDRLPVGEWGGPAVAKAMAGSSSPATSGTGEEEVELVVWAQAPATAKFVGLGVRALNQVGEDYAAFSGFSLQALAP